jgi:hypothetical protein
MTLSRACSRSSFFLWLVLILPALGVWSGEPPSGPLEGLAFRQADTGAMESFSFSFEGYTNYWQEIEWDWYSSRGLFLLSRLSVESEIRAMEDEIGNQLILEELWVQPGFIQRLAEAGAGSLEWASTLDTPGYTSSDSLLIAVTDQEPFAKTVLEKIPEEFQFRRNRAFTLEGKDRTLFVLACHSRLELERLKKHVVQAVEIVRKYELHRGLAGITTNYLHITPGQLHNPFELIDLSLSLGCSWLSVNGFNDWMLPGPVNEALGKIGFPFPFISGQYVTGGLMYGMEDYPDVQDNTLEECLDWAERRGGYFFADTSQSGSELADRFSGYILAGAGDWGKISELDAPFVTRAGDIDTAAPPTLLVLLEKNTPLTQENLFAAILEQRSVAVFPKGELVGPPELRDGLRLLLLDRAFLERQLTGPVSLQARVEGQDLVVRLRNLTGEPLEGEIQFQHEGHIRLEGGGRPVPVPLEGYEHRDLAFPLSFEPEASGRDNPIGVTFATSGSLNRALAHIDLPRAVELTPLMLQTTLPFDYPITIYNYSRDKTVPVSAVLRTAGGEVKKEFTEHLTVGPGRTADWSVPMKLGLGDYILEATALGVTVAGQIAIRAQEGNATAREEDLDGDGIPEVVMENESTRATILMYGGRVIEYIVKSKDENLMFKLWPEKPPLEGQVAGTRSFYPYGGLEEFTGYPYIGGHIVFHHEIEQDSGPFVRVRVWANIHGNKIVKYYTLFADSPVLEARYEMEEMTPTINVIGINPLFQVGPSTGPEDRYYFPEKELLTTVPELERYYGRGVFPEEGWAAGYDTEMDICLVIGYPVDDAIYLHLWNNHPDNTPTPYYYTELQPWLELKHGTKTYFSYYVLGQSGPYEPLVETLRNLGLMTERTREKPWSY